MTSTKKSNYRQSQPKKPTYTSLSQNFHRYFRLQFANNKALRRHAFKIRHNLYCNELGWKMKGVNKWEPIILIPALIIMCRNTRSVKLMLVVAMSSDLLRMN